MTKGPDISVRPLANLWWALRTLDLRIKSTAHSGDRALASQDLQGVFSGEPEGRPFNRTDPSRYGGLYQ
jgi:hypothetical protein